MSLIKRRGYCINHGQQLKENTQRLLNEKNLSIMSRYIEKIKKKALQGDANAQHELAFEYYSGTKKE